MNKPSPDCQAQINRVLCESDSIPSTARMTGTGVNTVVKLLRDATSASFARQPKTLRNLPCERLQWDEFALATDGRPAIDYQPPIERLHGGQTPLPPAVVPPRN